MTDQVFQNAFEILRETGGFVASTTSRLVEPEWSYRLWTTNLRWLKERWRNSNELVRRLVETMIALANDFADMNSYYSFANTDALIEARDGLS